MKFNKTPDQCKFQRLDIQINLGCSRYDLANSNQRRDPVAN
jgi:hypothetical protein